MLAASTANTLEQFTEEQQYVPVVLGRALDVATFPGFLHQVGYVPSRDHTALLQISLVAHDDDGGFRGSNNPGFQDLLSDSFDVLKAVEAADVVDKDISMGTAKSSAACICPLLQRINWEGGYGWKVHDLQVVDVAVHDHGRQVDAPCLGRHAHLAELVVKELTDDRALSDPLRPKHGDLESCHHASLPWPCVTWQLAP